MSKDQKIKNQSVKDNKQQISSILQNQYEDAGQKIKKKSSLLKNSQLNENNEEKDIKNYQSQKKFNSRQNSYAFLSEGKFIQSYQILDEFPDGIAILGFNESNKPKIQYCNINAKKLLKIYEPDQIIQKINHLERLSVIESQDDNQLQQTSINQLYESSQLQDKFFSEQKPRVHSLNMSSPIINISTSQLQLQFVNKQFYNLNRIFDQILYKSAINFNSMYFQEFFKQNDSLCILYCILNGYLQQDSRFQERCLEIKVFYTQYDKNPQILLLIRDVSYRDHIKILREQSKAKQASLNFVSHEYRTPLNCIITLLESAQEEIPKENEQLISISKNLEIVIQNCYYLLNLSNDLLDLAQMKVGKFQLSQVEFDLQELLKSCLKLFEVLSHKKQIELILNYDENVPKIIYSDENRIKQVIINLLGNAFKFTLKGSVQIIVKMLNNNIQLSIQDSGLGIEKNQIGRLMTAFGKCESDENKQLNRQGVGLGLLISNMIAQELNKENKGIEVISEVNNGSQFSFYITINDLQTFGSRANTIHAQKKDKYSNQLQVQQLDQIQEISSVFHSINDIENIDEESSIQDIYHSDQFIHQDKKKNQKCDCVKILIIDDVQFNIIAMQILLKKYQILNIDYAISGQQGINLILEKLEEKCCKTYRLIFLDLEMPQMNGYETFSRIRQIDHCEQIPIVACSGYHSAKEKEQAMTLGMNEYLEKPLKKDELERILQKYL